MTSPLRTDLTDACRQLRRSPAFSALAVLLLATGLGAVIGIHALFHSIVLQPLPYAQPDRLVGFRALNHAKAIDQEGVSVTDFRDFAARATAFATAGAVRPGFVAFTPEDGMPVQLITGLVTAGFFDVFGVAPVRGRAFLPEEFSFAAARTVVLSTAAAERFFGSVPAALGSQMRLDDESHTVVGVMPASFREPAFVDAWLPFPAESPEYFARDSRFWNAFGRLAPGFSTAAAHTEIHGLSQELAREHPDANRDWTAAVRPLLEQRTAGIRLQLLLLLAAVGLLLLIVCGNLANLLLARAIARLPDLGVRLALGATPARLARVMRFEGLVLAGAGGLGGLLLAAAALPVVASRIPPALLPRAHEVSLPPAALAVGLGAALLSALLCTALPARQLRRADVNAWLKDGPARGATGRGLGRWQAPLVSGQVALTVAVLAVALLLMQSLLRLNRVPPGFVADDVLTFRLSPPPGRYETNEELARYYEDLIDALRRVPGVASAAVNASTPLNGITLAYPSWREGTDTDTASAVEAVYAPVSEDFFRTLRIPVHTGRTFNVHDNEEGAPVAVINEAYARRMFPDGDAVGRRVMILPWMGPIYREIVGIVGDTRQTSLAEPPPPQVYVPQRQMPWFFSTLLVRLEQPAAASAVVAALRAHDNTLPVTPVALREAIAGGAAAARLHAWLFTVFAGLAVTVSALGLHASLSFALAQRRKEFGIRLALGATPAAIHRLVLGRASRLTGTGLIAGLALSFPAGFALRGHLFGVGSVEPATCAVLILVVALVTLATALPLARRAARVPPALVLQSA